MRLSTPGRLLALLLGLAAALGLGALPATAVTPAPVVLTPVDGSTTNNNLPVYSGTASAGATVTLFIDGAPIGFLTADASGSWGGVGFPLTDGSHTISAIADDGSGPGPFSNTNTFTVDTTAPAAPVVTTPADGSTTGNSTPTVSGTVEANATVHVFIDGAAVGITLADGAGAWLWIVPFPLSDGPHTARATATDAVGNTSPSSGTNTFTVDTTAPAAPVVITPADGSTTTDSTPTVSGTAEANSTITVLIDGASIGTTTANGAGTWSTSVPTALSDGPHTARATATDAVGNTSPSSSTNTFTVDTTPPPPPPPPPPGDSTPPAPPVITAPADGSSTTDSTPTVTGTSEAGAAVVVTERGRSVCSATTDPLGDWTCEAAEALGTGEHTFAATATDAAGNGSAAATTTFTVTPADPDRDHDGLTNDQEATLGTDPDDADTDDDGLTDGREVAGMRITEQFEVCGHGTQSRIEVTTDPLAADTDGDGLGDRTEVRGYRIGQRVVVSRAGDTITIGWTRSDPTAADTDHDGLPDAVERTGSANTAWQHRKTDPSKCDTDRGGANDGNEVEAGSDPTRVTSTIHSPRWQLLPDERTVVG